MTISIASDLLDRIGQHAAAAVPEECCGILFGRIAGERRIVERIRPADNVWSGDRRKRYQIDPGATFEALRGVRHGDPPVLGFYHSHPDGSAVPSKYDRESAWPGKSYVIGAVRDGGVVGVRSWRLAMDENAFVEERID